MLLNNNCVLVYCLSHVGELSKSIVRLVALQECRTPLEGPLAVSITYRKPRPAGHPKCPTKGQPWPWAAHRRPDLDNLTKPTVDALTGVVWGDDAQIVDLHLRKEFGDRDEVIVTVTEAVEFYAEFGAYGLAVPVGQTLPLIVDDEDGEHDEH